MAGTISQEKHPLELDPSQFLFRDFDPNKWTRGPFEPFALTTSLEDNHGEKLP
jgi:hypothetical protein